MSSFLQFALVLVIILVFAKVSGYISTRLGQPSVLGELLVGILLGPSVVNLMHLNIFTDLHLESFIKELGELGVLLLMFLAGLELHLKELAGNLKVSAFAGILGVLIPVGSGWAAGLALGMASDHAAFVGLTLGATSVSISAQTLIELKSLRSKVGLGLLGAAVFDDVLVILLLSIFLVFESGVGGFLQILFVLLQMTGFLALSVLVGIFVLPRLARFVRPLPISQGSLTLAVAIMLIYGILAEVLGGMAAITGTFIAGLMFARTPEKVIIENGLRSLAYGFFVPIFFVSIGLAINIRQLGIEALWTTIILSLVAVIGKILGAGLGSRLAKFTWIESLQLGIGMISRGEVGLIVAQVGLGQGLITKEILSAIVGVVLISTLLTPVMLKRSFSQLHNVTATAK
jgi:Kef-type K+ transport system membrane component KefB